MQIYCTYDKVKVNVDKCNDCGKLYECDNMWCDNHKCMNCEYKENGYCKGE